VKAEDFRPLLETEIARALLDFERRASDVLQRAIDRIDGSLIERALAQIDFSLASDGDGTAVLTITRGEVKKDFTIEFPRMAYQGPFAEAVSLRKGDAVTWNGSIYVARKDNPEGKPGDGPDWTLAVKKGRDGWDSQPPTANRVKPPETVKVR
jgi:hypothetical protein